MTAVAWVDADGTCPWLDDDGNFCAEYQATPDAGLLLGSGERWWGSRIRYRFPGERRWRRFLVIDLHPMDEAAIRGVIEAHARKARS